MENRTFNGERLKEALQFREKKMTELANEISISKQSLSLYANGGNIPPFENVKKIAKALSFPTDFFMVEDGWTTTTGNTYFRSQASTTRKSRAAQIIKLEYVARMYEVLLNYINFPELNLPKVDIDLPENSMDTDSDVVFEGIEQFAANVRKFWDLGNGPIESLQYVLESNGIIVTGFSGVESNIDAFSQQISVNGRTVYIIALALGEKPLERLRFDMAHELGHILMHTWGENNEDISKMNLMRVKNKLIFLPVHYCYQKDGFSRMVSAYPTNVDYYKSLKKKWKVSMQAMMYRTRQLDIISANQFQYMMRIVSKKGWRIKEPGDVPGQLKDTIFQGAIDLLFDGGYLSVNELMREFNHYGIILSQKDLENLMGLREGTLYQESKVIPFMTVKNT